MNVVNEQEQVLQGLQKEWDITLPETVSEAEILDAMRRVRALKGWIIEGAAAVAVAAFLKNAERYRGKRVAVVICGANVSEKVLSVLG